jgi:hypothetical protein
VHELRAELDRHAGARLEQREHAPADAVAALEHDHSFARSRQLPCGHQSCRAGADDDDVVHRRRAGVARDANRRRRAFHSG